VSVPRAWLVEALPRDWERRARSLGAVAIHTGHARLTARQALDVKAAGFGLFCYTVNAPARARKPRLHIFAKGLSDARKTKI